MKKYNMWHFVFWISDKYTESRIKENVFQEEKKKYKESYRFS